MMLKLGLDIGVASVGWGIIDENYNIIDNGVRLFSENSADGNLTRRTMRSTRRRLRRVRHRLQRMEKILSRVLGIEKPAYIGNIYEVRCRGLVEKLTEIELFAAVMHLAKRRGTHFLTAEDFEKTNGQGKSTEEILQEQESKLQDKYVCQIQYEKIQRDGKVRGIENRFRNKEYRKELVALLEKQGEYYPAIKAEIENILKIYDSKREYFEGPGGPNSPTPYGRFRYDEAGKIIEVNLIELMRGKCTFFPDEKRIASNSYTACLFNLLNDLNNMTAGGKPISYEQKRELIEQYIDEGKDAKLQIIAKITGVKPDELRGYRIDKSDKPIFTEFSGYKAILKALNQAGIDSSFVKGNRELVDSIAEILTSEKDVEKRYEALVASGISAPAAQELKKLSGFTNYHSLSQRAMELILDDLWETDENQMQLFTKAGLFKQEKLELRGTNIPFDGSEWIVSPITKRAVNEAIKVINEVRAFVRKKYNSELSEIVIEMAREKNSKEQTDFLKKLQQKNEDLRRQIGSLVDLKKINSKQFELMKLLLEQDFKCAYSLKPVSIAHVLSGCLEIDHIIPRSLSFDDSLANKVAVFIEENQKKGQNTPYQYLKSGRGHISYEEYKDWVLHNENYKKNKKKRENLLYEGNPAYELEGFINRNLVDTRYACKEVLNLLQAYFKENKLDTKVSVIKGSFTHAFRKKAQLNKDRVFPLIFFDLNLLKITGQIGIWQSIVENPINSENGGNGKAFGKGPLRWHSKPLPKAFQKGNLIILYLGHSVKDYIQNFLYKLEPATLLCPACQASSLVRHGAYRRSLTWGCETFIITVYRVKCCHCGRTHAILPDFIAPYRHYALPDIEEAVSRVLDRTIPVEKASSYCDVSTVKRWVYAFKVKVNTVIGLLNSMAIRLYDRAARLIATGSSLNHWQQLLAALSLLGSSAASSEMGLANIYVTSDQTMVFL